MSTLSHTLNNFFGFLASAGASNPALAPITTAAAAASKAVVADTVNGGVNLVTHELDVIAAHNKASPYIGVAADFAKLLFTAWVAQAVPAAASPAADQTAPAQ